MKTYTERNNWLIGRVTETFIDKYGTVRNVLMRVRSGTDVSCKFVRLTTKLVLLFENNSPIDSDGTYNKIIG